jgi:arylsulfatase A-like enzyme
MQTQKPTDRRPQDKFAAEGTRFDQAHVSYTVCSQSRVSFVTGWPTHVRGHRTLWSLLHDWEPNLLKYFKSSGYDVRWWGKNDMLAPDAWNASVNSAKQMAGGNNGPNPYALNDARHYSFLSSPWPKPANTTQDYANVAEAIAYLARFRPGIDPPFAIFLPLLKPHPPCVRRPRASPLTSHLSPLVSHLISSHPILQVLGARALLLPSRPHQPAAAASGRGRRRAQARLPQAHPQLRTSNLET